MNPDTSYRGRFAPSPTGPLHFGSLVAAVGSCLEARTRQGTWLLRMEDLDRPRCSPRAAGEILHALEAFGFEWDGPVLYQSRHDEAYGTALARLRALGAVYPCACTRREIADSAVHGIEGYVYPGTCRGGIPDGREARAWRVDTRGAAIAFDDAIQGRQAQDLEREIGDFVVKRADGLFAYQLAVVVDDAEQGITHVVRGADLLDSTPRQIHLQRLLGLPTPHYAHLPVAVNTAGEKLSKQTRAAPVDGGHPVPQLVRALAFLGQQPPPGLEQAALAEYWQWARENWRLDKVPRQRTIPA
jgi:glutamyl-Q tRNA(Asp) synthetase